MPEYSHNQIRGYKAAAHNPDNSEEAQQKARSVLRDVGESEDTRRGGRTGASNTEDLESHGNVGNVVGGYKATLKNPKVSDQAKQHAEQVLREHDAI